MAHMLFIRPYLGNCLMTSLRPGGINALLEMSPPSQLATGDPLFSGYHPALLEALGALKSSSHPPSALSLFAAPAPYRGSGRQAVESLRTAGLKTPKENSSRWLTEEALGPLGLTLKAFTSVRKHSNGRIKHATLAHDYTAPNGAQFAAGTRVYFTKNGEFEGGKLAMDFHANEDLSLKAGSAVRFHPDGSVQMGFLLQAYTDMAGTTFKAATQIAFHENGRVRRGVIAEPYQSCRGAKLANGMELLPGSTLSFSKGGYLEQARVLQKTPDNRGRKFTSPQRYKITFYRSGALKQAYTEESFTDEHGHQITGVVAFHPHGALAHGRLAADALMPDGTRRTAGAYVYYERDGSFRPS